MTLKQILYVRAVSKAGSIGKAAESLFISQSSLSESIRNLEREYGMVLFERTSKGISLTRQGEAFLKDTQLLTNIYQDLDDKYKNHKGECEYFCVSSLHHVSGIDAFEHIVCPVSYTHLDVYKRQILYSLRHIFFPFYNQCIKISSRTLRR